MAGEDCTGCAICAEERCPMKAIEMKGDIAFVNTKECIGCGLCVTGCPAEAIKLVERKQIPSIPATVREMGAKVLQEKGRLDAFQQNGHTMGCPIGNLSLELAGTNERLRVHLKDVIGSLIAQIESCLEEARRDKSIPASLNTADAARLIFYGFEGAILHMKVVKNIEPFRAFRSYLTGYFENIKA
ncbi:MAG: TetR family transcriptional regulator C-terminal domain-containing protein [Smithella sp.]